MNGHAGTTFRQCLGDTAHIEGHTVLYGNLSAEIQGWLEDPANPALNLPSKVLFPDVASDVVVAVDFFPGERPRDLSQKLRAQLQCRIDPAGHPPCHMNHFKRYAPTGIVECGGSDGDDALCALALARGKPGYIRFGGGDIGIRRTMPLGNSISLEEQNTISWGEGPERLAPVSILGIFERIDATSPPCLLKILDSSRSSLYFKFVFAVGWAFQGDLAGTTGARKHGFGIDQVIQIEMVLPNGLYFKFGPTEWEDATADGFLSPRSHLLPLQPRRTLRGSLGVDGLPQ